MSDDMHSGLCYVMVLCLLVIAMSMHRMAYGQYSYFNDQVGGTVGAGALSGSATNPRYMTQVQGGLSSFNGEPPVFWNLGDVESINSALQEGALVQESNNEYTEDKVVNYNYSLGLKMSQVNPATGRNFTREEAMAAISASSFRGGRSYMSDDFLKNGALQGH